MDIKERPPVPSWGSNVSVKIAVTNTRREFEGPLLRRLSRAGVALNITAVMTNDQVQQVMEALEGTAPAFCSRPARL